MADDRFVFADGYCQCLSPRARPSPLIRGDRNGPIYDHTRCEMSVADLAYVRVAAGSTLSFFRFLWYFRVIFIFYDGLRTALTGTGTSVDGPFLHAPQSCPRIGLRFLGIPVLSSLRPPDGI